MRRRAPFSFFRAPFFLSVLILAVAGSARLAPAAPRDVAALLEAAQDHFGAGHYSVAIATLRAAVARNPGNAEAHYWLGRSYYEIGDFNSAAAEAERSVALDGGDSVYHQWLGRAYGEKAERERSFFVARRVKNEFERAVALDPRNISARRDLEEYCIQAPWVVGGSKDQAYAQAQAIAALDPMQGHLARAAFFDEAQKRYDWADSEYRLILNGRAPANMDAYFEIMHFYQTRKQPAGIEWALREAAAVDPGDARLDYYRGVSRVLSRSDLAAAERDLQSFLANAPDRSDWPPRASACEWLGMLYETQGNRTAAAEQYREALRLDPSRGELRDRLRRLE